jgi:hypothetical protein
MANRHFQVIDCLILKIAPFKRSFQIGKSGREIYRRLFSRVGAPHPAI